MKRSLGLSRSKGSKLPAKRQTDKLDSSESSSLSSCNEVDSGLSSAEEDKSQSGDGSSGIFEVQLFRQSPSTSMVSDAHQPKSASDSAPFGSVDQSLESTFSTSASRTTLISSIPSTSSAAVSASSSSSLPPKQVPIQFPLKRPANDAKPTTSKKQKSKGASQNIPLITSFFKKRSDTPSAASHTRHPVDSESSGTDEEDVEGSDESQPDPGPSTSNQNTRQPKLPVKGSKTYNRCLENWNIFKEMEELIATRPDLTQQERYKIVASRRKKCKWGAINANYRKTLIRIEMSGKAITPNHPLNNELFHMLTITNSKVDNFSKAKANDKDEETAGGSETTTRKYAIDRFKKGSHDYNRILSSWETYKEVETLRTSQPDLEGNKDRCQFLATSKNVPFSTIYNKFDFVQRRLNLVNQYVSVNQPFDEELIQILAIPQSQLTKQQKLRPFSDFQTDDEKAETVKRTLEQAFDFNVPPKEHFLFAAKLLNTTEREVRVLFVKRKISECKEKRVESTAALQAIRQESINTLANFHISQLCELTAHEKAILAHFELAAEPYSIKCTLPHNRDGGSIGFTLYCRQMLLFNSKYHFKISHSDYYKNFEASSSLLPVRPDVHRLYSILVESLNYPSFVSHLIILSNLTRLPDSTAAAEKIFINDDEQTFDFPAKATGICAKDKWIFSFFRSSESFDHFKCRLWHAPNSPKLVPSEVYFKDGLLVEKHLYHHLYKYHGIGKDFGAANDAYTDAPSGQTISLKSMPIETFNLLTRLLDTDQMPFQEDCSNSIDADGNIYPLENSHTNASELSSFVKELSEDEFKVLALFKPGKSNTDVHCRLHHKIRCDTVNCSRGTTINKDTVLFALKGHLIDVHRMTVESRKNGTEVVNRKIKMSLTCMPLDTIAWFFNVAHGKVNKSNLKENSSITPLATHSLLVENEDEDELKPDPDPWVEIAMIKCMPSAYFSISNSPSELSKTLNLSQKIRDVIRLDKSTNASNARNYLVFLKAVTSSVHDFIDAILYGGFTDCKLADKRIKNYVADVQHIIDGKQTLEQLNEKKNKEMLGSMVACWRAGSESYAHYLTENRWMTQSEALFTERSVIASLKYLPINCNKLHGSTASYSEVLTKHGITEQLICKAGIAELVLFFQKHQIDRRFATPVQINSDHITRTPSPTPKYLLSSGVLETIQIPPYSLICPPLPIDLHKHYAVHLFMALFTLPAKDTFWYLKRVESYEQINLLDESHRNEVTESINSVLSYLSFDFHQCLHWAQQLWHTIFVANVAAANRELGNTASRHPASKQTHKHNIDFISVSALLLAKVIGLKDENGDEFTIKSFELPTIEFLESPGAYRVEDVPVYNKLQLFTDLAHIDFPSLDNFINAGDKPQHTVTPLDPFPDDTLFNKFFLSTISLKYFNFEGTLTKKLYIAPQFKILPFLWASRFHRII